MRNSAGSLLVDIGALPLDRSQHVLDVLAKAVSGEDDGGPDIWALHHSPYVRSLIELFSSRGLLRLDKVKTELSAWLEGKRHAEHAGDSMGRPQISAAPTADELALVRIYLENLPAAEFTVDDWGLLVDYLVGRYMPASAMKTEAEWLAVRSVFMGKVQANLDRLSKPVTVAEADGLLGAMPTTVDAAREAFRPSRIIENILSYGYARCADSVQAITEDTRHRLKRVIMAHQEQVLLGDNPPKQALQQRLFDEFATLNRDWRRIAVTEVGNNANQGLIASLKPGTRVRRMEQYKGACPYCKKINGAILTVVDPAQKMKNGQTEVWVGKTNIGRSGAARKRVGDTLIPRTEAELWWIPAGTVHPHCRGQWHVLEDAQPDDDPDFAAWLNAHFAKSRPNPHAPN